MMLFEMNFLKWKHFHLQCKQRHNKAIALHCYAFLFKSDTDEKSFLCFRLGKILILESTDILVNCCLILQVSSNIKQLKNPIYELVNPLQQNKLELSRATFVNILTSFAKSLHMTDEKLSNHPPIAINQSNFYASQLFMNNGNKLFHLSLLMRFSTFRDFSKSFLITFLWDFHTRKILRFKLGNFFNFQLMNMYLKFVSCFRVEKSDLQSYPEAATIKCSFGRIRVLLLSPLSHEITHSASKASEMKIYSLCFVPFLWSVNFLHWNECTS